MRIRRIKWAPVLAVIAVVILCSAQGWAQDNGTDSTTQGITPASQSPQHASVETTIKKDLSTNAHGTDKKDRMPSGTAPTGKDKALPGEEIPGTGLEGNY